MIVSKHLGKGAKSDNFLLKRSQQILIKSKHPRQTDSEKIGKPCVRSFALILASKLVTQISIAEAIKDSAPMRASGCPLIRSGYLVMGTVGARTAARAKEAQPCLKAPKLSFASCFRSVDLSALASGGTKIRASVDIRIGPCTIGGGTLSTPTLRLQNQLYRLSSVRNDLHIAEFFEPLLAEFNSNP
jgi:hypothetical protein